MTPVAAVKSRDSKRLPTATPAMTVMGTAVTPSGPVVESGGKMECNSIIMNVTICM